MTSSITTPYGPIGAHQAIRPTSARTASRRVRDALGWLAACAAVTVLLGGGALLAVKSVPASECAAYDSCTLAALVTYGTPA